MSYPVIDKRSNAGVPSSARNTHEFIAIHYLGVDGQNYNLSSGGFGGHATIYWDGTIYLRCYDTAVIWAVGASSGWKQEHPTARNHNTYSIEMCCHNDGDAGAYAKDWYFTQATQEAAVQLVRQKFNDFGWPLTAASVNQHLLRHGDITTKPCPNPYICSIGYKTNWTWEQFKQAVVTGVCPNSGSSAGFVLSNTNKALDKNTVRTMQSQLIDLGISCGSAGADGQFGEGTYKAVKAFQERYKDVYRLAVDGDAGNQTRTAIAECDKIRKSDLLDLNFYRNKYSDLKKAYPTDNGGLIRHFIVYGMKEGRQGSPTFNVHVYKNRYADLQKAFGNDLRKYYIHWINFGKRERRKAV